LLEHYCYVAILFWQPCFTTFHAPSARTSNTCTTTVDVSTHRGFATKVYSLDVQELDSLSPRSGVWV